MVKIVVFSCVTNFWQKVIVYMFLFVFSLEIYFP